MCWEEAALYCVRIFGSYLDIKEQFFVCPECGEPIYKEDWDYKMLDVCPVCDFPWLDEEE